MNFPDVHDRMEGVRNDLTDSWQLIEDNIPLAAGVTEAHRAWYPDLLRRITANGRAFLTEALETLRAQAARRPFDDPIRLEVENAIFAYRLQLHELSIDYED